MWYVALFFVLVAIVLIVFCLRTDPEKNKQRAKWLGNLGALAFIAALAFAIAAEEAGNQKQSDKDKAALQALGFRGVVMIYSREAGVSLQGYPVGCRVTLNRDDGKWLANIAGVKYKTPITDASEFTQRKEFIRWCGP